MTEWMKSLDDLGPKKIVHVYDPDVGLKAVAVVHTTAYGRCAGGTRMAPDITTDEMVRLARIMTWKYTIYGIPQGGGKMGIWADPLLQGPKRETLFRVLGKALKPLLDAGIGYGQDMGTYAEDFGILREAGGQPPRRSSLKGVTKDGDDLAFHFTGYGVVVSAKVCCEWAGIPLKGAKVAVEGFGKVGCGMARYADEEGAKVVAISTINGTAYNPNGLDVKTLLEARRKLGDRAVEEYEDAQHVDREMIYFLPVDILMPGARPDVIDINNISRVQAKIIAPGANIPATEEAMDVMLQRGIHYIPDFVANIGGTIGPYVGILGGTPDQAFKAMRDNVTPLTLEVMDAAGKEGVTPFTVAERIAREKFLKIRAEGKVLTGKEYLKLLRKNLKLD